MIYNMKNNILLKDLCARLPYSVKCQIQEDECTYIGTLCRIEVDNRNGHLLDFVESVSDLDCQVYLTEVKPYLFPLSSMTEEQREELITLINTGQNDNNEFMRSLCRIEFYHKNHFDYQGLIPMELAINATNLNIY